MADLQPAPPPLNEWYRIRVYLGTVESNGVPVDAVKICYWTSLVMNMLGGLCGGATAYGMRDSEFCRAMGKILAEKKDQSEVMAEQVFVWLSSMTGIYCPDYKNDPTKTLRERVLQQGEFQSADLDELLRIGATTKVQREPVVFVESLAKDFDEAKKRFVILLAKATGLDMGQAEVFVEFEPKEFLEGTGYISCSKTGE